MKHTADIAINKATLSKSWRKLMPSMKSDLNNNESPRKEGKERDITTLAEVVRGIPGGEHFDKKCIIGRIVRF